MYGKTPTIPTDSILFGSHVGPSTDIQFSCLGKKVSVRSALIRHLTGTECGADQTTLRTSTLAIVHCTAEYYAPVYGRCAHTHHVDTPINAVLQIVSGCVKATPTAFFPELTGIQPADLRRENATLALAKKDQKPDHLLHQVVTKQHSSQCIHSRRPFAQHARTLLELNQGTASKRSALA